jgi:hypothetical protein
MVPHKHFLIAAIIAAPAALVFAPESPVINTGEWMLISGIVSAAIDLDIYALVFIRSRKKDELKPFRSLRQLYSRFDHFMDTIIQTGVRRISITTHCIVSIVLVVVSYFFWKTYCMPVAIGVSSHIICDMPKWIKNA